MFIDFFLTNGFIEKQIEVQNVSEAQIII